MKTKNISQAASFKASPGEIFDILLDSRKLTALTGGKCSMSRKVNGKFNVFDGYCHGYNVELKAGKKIVQAWHFAEDGWPDDHFSICTFELEKNPGGTKLKFRQTGVPEHKVESLKGGWKQFYWEPMKKFLAARR